MEENLAYLSALFYLTLATTIKLYMEVHKCIGAKVYMWGVRCLYVSVNYRNNYKQDSNFIDIYFYNPLYIIIVDSIKNVSSKRLDKLYKKDWVWDFRWIEFRKY